MTMQIVALVMGIVSLILAQCTSIPQLIELVKTRNSSGISLWTYVIFNITSVVWVVWSFSYYFNALATETGELTKLFQWTLLPAVIMNVSNIFTMSCVLILKIVYSNQAKKLHVSELELSKILLNKDKTKGNFKKYLPMALYLFIVTVLLTAMTVIMAIYGRVKIPGANNWTPWVMVVNAIGAVSWEAVSWPQFIKSIREKDTTGVSIGWAVFLPVSCTVMFTYDLTMALSGSEGFNYGILFSLIFNGMISSYGVLILKISNLVKAHKMNLTEVEYTKKVLLPLVEKKKIEKAKQKAK